MHFEGGRGVCLRASTALPLFGQFIRQSDGTTILTDHRLKALEQGDGDSLGRLHHHRTHFLDHCVQEPSARLGKALVDGRVRHRHPAHLGQGGQVL